MRCFPSISGTKWAISSKWNAEQTYLFVKIMINTKWREYGLPS